MRRRAWLAGIGFLVVAGAAAAAAAVVLVVHGSVGGSRSQASPRSGSAPRVAPWPAPSAPGHTAAPRSTATPGATRCVQAAWTPAGSGSYAGMVRRPAVVRSQPGTGAILATVPRLDQNGLPNVFAILGARGNGCQPTWYRVRFATSGNGRIGWVGSWLVSTFRVDTRIVVRLSQRRLVMYRGGKPALSAPVAVGAAGTPTPTGDFFVTERWNVVDAGGPYGPAALAISAHSPVLHDWAEGGPIALHGTDEPASIGHAASHGCVRLDNATMRRLFGYALLGTPVVIRA